MTIAYTITPKLRTKFKEPFGTLIEGSFDETMTKMKELVEKEKPLKIISVGDIVSHNLHKHNLHPQLTIIDNKFLRTQSMPRTAFVEKTVIVNNPKGTITKEAILAIKEALEKNSIPTLLLKAKKIYLLSSLSCMLLKTLMLFMDNHMRALF